MKISNTANEYLNAFLLILVYLCSETLSRKTIIHFLMGYIPNVFFFFIKLSSLYFKLIYFIFMCIKSLFFLSFIPMIFQIFASAYFLFDLVWEIYLIVSIFSILHLFLPYYILLCIFSKQRFKCDDLCVEYQIKCLVILLFFITLNYIHAFSITTSLLLIECIDVYLERRKIRR